MKKEKFRLQCLFCWSLIQYILLSNPIAAQNLPLQHFESAFLAQDPYPAGLHSVDWFPDDLEVQGVTNDGSNWFFTIVNQGSSMFSVDVTEGMLWRIPKGVPLQGSVGNKPGVLMTKATDIPALKSGNHFHWGDPDHVRFEGVDYILVPIYTIVACFRADNLKYLNYANFDSTVAGGWCAVGADMKLYSSVNNTSSVVGYEVNWSKLTDKNNTDHELLSNPQPINLYQEDGSLLNLRMFS